MKRFGSTWIILLFFVLPLVLRLWGVGSFTTYQGDELVHVPAAKNYVETGHAAPEYWYHPPLRHILLYGSMSLLGNNPFGWRMRNVLLGALSVLILFLIARETLSSEKGAILAGLFLLFDPLHTLFSRSTFSDVPGAAFALLGFYASLLYVRGRVSSPAMAGVFLGLSVAMKWYFLPALAVLLLFTLYRRHERGALNPAAAFHILASFMLVPLAVYMLSFYFWFGRGYSLGEFVSMQVAAYREQQMLAPGQFIKFLAVSSSPWEWFARPLVFGFKTMTEGAWARFHLFMNYPPLWMLVGPALVFVAYRMLKLRDSALAAIVLIFGLSYLQFLFVERPIFIYSAISLAPYAYLALAYLLASVAESPGGSSWRFRLIVALIVVHGAYLYPLATDLRVPVALYSPVLSIAKVF